MTGLALVPASTTRRRGLTLPELLIALVLVGIVAGVATRALRTQQRFLRGAAELGEMRSQLRQAVHVLPAELRTVAPDAGDIREWSTSSIAFRSVTGGTVICRRASDTDLIVPPRHSADRRALTTWLVIPQPGDSMLVHDEADLGSADDAWRAYELASVGPAAAPEGCDGSGDWMVPDPGAGAPIRLRISGATLSPTIRAGAAVRIYRPARYALYQGGDAKWYLGASDCNAARLPPCSTIQPVSGPYLPRGADADGGLSLAFEDASGRTLIPGVDDPRQIALVRMMVRGETSHAWWRSSNHAMVRDSLGFAVAVRNRAGSGGAR